MYRWDCRRSDSHTLDFHFRPVALGEYINEQTTWNIYMVVWVWIWPRHEYITEMERGVGGQGYSCKRISFSAAPTLPLPPLKHHLQEGKVPLFVAASTGDVNVVAALISANADVDAEDQVCTLNRGVCIIWADSGKSASCCCATLSAGFCIQVLSWLSEFVRSMVLLTYFRVYKYTFVYTNFVYNLWILYYSV